MLSRKLFWRWFLVYSMAVIGCGSDAVADDAAQPRTIVDPFLRRSEEGWHFYREVIQAEEKKPDNRPTENTPATSVPEDPTPRQELRQWQEALENARAEAVLRPSEASLRRYLEKNQWMMRQSARFADTWRRVVWQTPALDYSLRRPNNHLALQVFHDERQKKLSAAIEAVAREYGLWFFFRGQCPYCHRLAPILKALADRTGLKVMPVSLDGGSLREFPAARQDTRVARELGVTTVPSVYLVNPRTRAIIPVANGLVSLDELKERIYLLTKTEPGDDF